MKRSLFQAQSFLFSTRSFAGLYFQAYLFLSYGQSTSTKCLSLFDRHSHNMFCAIHPNQNESWMKINCLNFIKWKSQNTREILSWVCVCIYICMYVFKAKSHGGNIHSLRAAIRLTYRDVNVLSITYIMSHKMCDPIVEA